MAKMRSRRKTREVNMSRQGDIKFFDLGDLGLETAEFFKEQTEAGDSATVVKKALVMVEGEHIDSSKRKHKFTADRIQKIVRNTNAFLARGGRVPWQKDHVKSQDANIGDLEGALEVRVITEDDLPNPRLRHLIGRVGAFTDRLVAKGKDVADQIVAGRIKSLSPGIDIVTDTIKEISATPTPAIVGLSTFSRGQNRLFGRAEFALTMQEAVQEQEDEDSVRDEFDDLSDKFWDVVTNISNAPQEEIGDQDPMQLLMQAIGDYAYMIQDLLGLTQEETQGAQPQMQPQMNQRGYAQMNRSEMLARFTMAGLEETAEFRKMGAKDKAPRKKRGLLGTAGMVAGGAAGVGALGGGVYGASLAIRRGAAKRKIAQAMGPEVAKRTNVMKDILQADRNRLTSAKNAVTGTAASMGQGIARGANRTKRLATAGYRAGAKAGGGGIGSVAKGVVGGAKGALRTTGGKAAAAGLGLAAAGAGYGAYRAIRGRKRRK